MDFSLLASLSLHEHQINQIKNPNKPELETNSLFIDSVRTFLCPFSSEPYLNGVGESIYFSIDGKDNDPNLVVKQLKEDKAELFRKIAS